MFNRGYYDYKAENKDIKTEYTVEFTRNKKVFEIMDTSEFNYNMLDKKQFDYLEDAISFWSSLYYDETVLHVMLYERVLLNGEIVLEQCKDMTLPTPFDAIIQQKAKQMKQKDETIEAYQNQLKKITNYLAKHGIDASKI